MKRLLHPGSARKAEASVHAETKAGEQISSSPKPVQLKGFANITVWTPNGSENAGAKLGGLLRPKRHQDILSSGPLSTARAHQATDSSSSPTAQAQEAEDISRGLDVHSYSASKSFNNIQPLASFSGVTSGVETPTWSQPGYAASPSQLQIGLGRWPGMLTRRIGRADSVSQLAAVLAQAPGGPNGINALHISAALTRLAKLVTGGVGSGSGSRCQGVVGASQAHAAHAGLGQDEVHTAHRLADSLTGMLMHRLPQMDARGLANAAWALAKLSKPPSPPLLNRMLFECYTLMTHGSMHGPSFQPMELAMLGWALAKMQIRPPHAWLLRFNQAVLQAVPVLEPSAAVQIAWALAFFFGPKQQHAGMENGHMMQIGMLQLEADLAVALAERGAELLSYMSVQETVTFVYSMQRMERMCAAHCACIGTYSPHASAASAAASAHATPHVSSPSVPPASAAAAASKVRTSRASMHSLSEDALFLDEPWLQTAVWQSQPLSSALLVQGQERLLSCAADLAPQDFSNWMTVLYRTHLAGSPLPLAPLLHALVVESCCQLHAFTPQGLTTTLQALEALRLPPSDAWLRTFDQYSALKAHHFKAHELACILATRMRFQPAPPASWMDAMVHAAAVQAGSMQRDNLSSVLWALERLGYQGQALPLLVSNVLQRLKHSTNSPQADTAGVSGADAAHSTAHGPTHGSLTVLGCASLLKLMKRGSVLASQAGTLWVPPVGVFTHILRTALPELALQPGHASGIVSSTDARLQHGVAFWAALCGLGHAGVYRNMSSRSGHQSACTLHWQEHAASAVQTAASSTACNPLEAWLLQYSRRMQDAPRHIPVMLHACARMGIQPGDAIMRSLVTAYTSLVQELAANWADSSEPAVQEAGACSTGIDSIPPSHAALWLLSALSGLRYRPEPAQATVLMGSSASSLTTLTCKQLLKFASVMLHLQYVPVEEWALCFVHAATAAVAVSPGYGLDRLLLESIRMGHATLKIAAPFSAVLSVHAGPPQAASCSPNSSGSSHSGAVGSSRYSNDPRSRSMLVGMRHLRSAWADALMAHAKRMRAAGGIRVQYTHARQLVHVASSMLAATRTRERVAPGTFTCAAASNTAARRMSGEAGKASLAVRPIASSPSRSVTVAVTAPVQRPSRQVLLARLQMGTSKRVTETAQKASTDPDADLPLPQEPHAAHMRTACFVRHIERVLKMLRYPGLARRWRRRQRTITHHVLVLHCMDARLRLML